jgi:hypothetical protein
MHSPRDRLTAVPMFEARSPDVASRVCATLSGRGDLRAASLSNALANEFVCPACGGVKVGNCRGNGSPGNVRVAAGRLR